MRIATRVIRAVAALLVAVLGTAVLPAPQLWADEAAAAADAAGPPAPGGAEAARGALHEVVVTATRREESLSKVPISVTAITQQDMDVKGLKDFQDIVRFTPGVSIDTSGTNNISIRGISSSAGAGTTGIYIDDTPIQMRDVGFNPDDTLPKTFDLARVEVLRGPQGTLFGSGSEGGTVRYILTQPSLTGSSSYSRSEASYTEYGEPSYELGIAHGQPIIDGTLGWRASAWYRYDGGWINRVDPTTGARTEANANHAGTAMLRLAGIWQPVGALTVTPSIIYQNARKHDESTFWPAYSNPSVGQFNTATPELMPVDDEWYLPALKLQWDLGKSQIISNTSYYHRKENTAYQGTVYDLSFFQLLGWPNNPLSAGLGCLATAPPNTCPWYPLIDGNGIHLPAGFTDFQTPNVMTNTQQSYIQELRWQSSDETSRWNWTVGVFWQLAKEGSVEELKDPNNEVNGFFNAIYGEPATAFFGPYYSCPTNAAYGFIPACDIYYLNNTTFDRQFAGYGELSYAITDRWKLTLGERVAHTTFNITSYSDGLENFGPIIPGQPLVPRTGSSSETPNTPKASLAYQMDPANLFYVTYAKGFRVGGGNPPLPSYCNTDLLNETGLTQAPLTYGSDSTQNYEVGSKNRIGGNLSLATSVYYIKWNNIQQSVYVAGSCGLQFIDNVGTAVSKGFDLQADLALDPVYFEFAAGYTEARFSADSPLQNSAGLPLVRNGDAISGQAAINSAPGTNPPWTVAVGAEYRFTPWQHEAFVRVDWEYQSRNPWLAALQDPNTSQFVAAQSPASYTLPATSFTSLRAGVSLGEWQLSAFVDNVFDSHTVINYQLGQADSYAFALGAPTPTTQQNQYTFRPRTVGLTATWRVGGGGH
ncbi:MAG TPA: TonB-dependent receptor [Steroidobacteraceae bacterium]|nr:TonB-dependent receptor [Steroidobacteraceae bacterium]